MAAVIAFDTEGKYIMLAAASVIHECGHLACIVLCGKKIDRITLIPGGFDIKYHGGRESYLNDIAIAFCGPLFNLTAAFVFSEWGGGERDYFVGVNLALCFFNLLPLYPLDGGRMTETALVWLLGPDMGTAAFRAISWTLASVGAAGAALWFLPKGRLWPVGVFAYLLYSQSRMSGRQMKNKKLLPFYRR